MKTLPLHWLILGAALSASGLRADVTLAPLFTDHAVLQRDKPVPIWGRAESGESVSVSFLGQTVLTQADRDGRWSVFLAPLAANGAGSDLVVSGKNTLALHDVVVGEVWLCSGQSNMEFPVQGPGQRVLNSGQEVAAAHYPLIRQFKVKKCESDVPLETATGTWMACSPATVGQFTAVGYFFAREIYRKLGVPVGLINSSYGGTPVEAWINPGVFENDPALATIWPRWRQTLAEYPKKQALYETDHPKWAKAKAEAVGAGPAKLAAFLQSNPEPYPSPRPGDPSTPSGLFNGMINPLLPYALRGALWYQGEANVFRASEYHRLFAAMITAWRARFEQGDFPFYWVQLPNYDQANDPTRQAWSYLREAQAQTLSLPATAQAVAIDIGENFNIHPHNKQEVGRRLALIAKDQVYGVPGDFSGPVFTGAAREGSALRVTFKYAETGLTAAGKPLQSLEVAGADRQFYPAVATISGDALIVRSPQVPVPVAVRYAWGNTPGANLYNGAGLPAAPFRSDGW